ncbi:MAG TPA: hypothetical protein VGO93_28500, partial [Candidatus Xenobia bacterium]
QYHHVEQNLRPWSEVARLTPRLSFWFWPPAESLCWGWYSTRLWNWMGGPTAVMPMENTLFPGGLPWLLLAVAIVLLGTRKVAPERVRIAAACLGAVAFLFALTLTWPNGTTLWWWVWKFLPGAGEMRSISRIWMVVSALAVPGSILCIDSWLSQARRGAWVMAVVLVLCVVDQAVLVPPEAEDTGPILVDVHAMADIMRTGTVAYVGISHHEQAGATHALAMWGGMEAGVPVINGLTAQPPRGYPYMTASTQQLLDWLGPYRGRLTLIYPPAADPPDALAIIFAHDHETRGAAMVEHLDLPLQRVFRTGLEAGPRLAVANLGEQCWPAQGPYRVSVLVNAIDVSLPQDLAPGDRLTLDWPPGLRGPATVKVVQDGVSPDYRTADGVLHTNVP